MFSIQQQIACVSREIGKRRTAYPKWVYEGRMTQEQADREISTMEAVLQTLKGLTPREKTLFEDQAE